jgi:hypothetical protein
MNGSSRTARFPEEYAIALSILLVLIYEYCVTGEVPLEIRSRYGQAASPDAANPVVSELRRLKED